MLGNQQVRFGGGRKEKDCIIRTSPAVYPTTFLSVEDANSQQWL